MYYMMSFYEFSIFNITQRRTQVWLLIAGAHIMQIHMDTGHNTRDTIIWLHTIYQEQGSMDSKAREGALKRNTNNEARYNFESYHVDLHWSTQRRNVHIKFCDRSIYAKYWKWQLVPNTIYWLQYFNHLKNGIIMKKGFRKRCFPRSN